MSEPASGQLAPGRTVPDREEFGRLAAESQADAELLLANQVPETSALVRVARDAGAVAARSFGAGFGGSAWAMIESAGGKDDRQFLDRWMSAYRNTCPEASAHSVAFVSKPGPPVTVAVSWPPSVIDVVLTVSEVLVDVATVMVALVASSVFPE